MNKNEEKIDELENYAMKNPKDQEASDELSKELLIGEYNED